MRARGLCDTVTTCIVQHGIRRRELNFGSLKLLAGSISSDAAEPLYVLTIAEYRYLQARHSTISNRKREYGARRVDREKPLRVKGRAPWKENLCSKLSGVSRLSSAGKLIMNSSPHTPTLRDIITHRGTRPITEEARVCSATRKSPEDPQSGERGPGLTVSVRSMSMVTG